MNDDPADEVAKVLSLCRALRDGRDMLKLSAVQQADLLACVARAEAAATATPIDRTAMGTEVRAIRYLLVEIADGPISAFMADAAARMVGDDIGRLFS